MQNIDSGCMHLGSSRFRHIASGAIDTGVLVHISKILKHEVSKTKWYRAGVEVMRMSKIFADGQGVDSGPVSN